MADLLPCPFCGGEAQLSEGISYYVFCPDCGAEGPWDDDSRDKAINGWNARPLIMGEAWQPIETAPADEHILAAVQVINNKTGASWWERLLAATLANRKK